MLGVGENRLAHLAPETAAMEPDTAVSARQLDRQRRRRRLQVLLAIDVIVLVLFVISRLEPWQIKSFGPLVASIHQLLDPRDNNVPDRPSSDLMAEVGALGGRAVKILSAQESLPSARALPANSYYVTLSGPAIDDDKFARFIDRHGSQISALALQQTRVSDRGLRHLQKLPILEQISLVARAGPAGSCLPLNQITDSGMVYLNIPKLTRLNLSGLPITDAGLNALAGLPNLERLHLSRTKVRGPGLSRLKSLPNLDVLELDDSAMTDEGLTHLAGASNLHILRLDGVPITAAGLEHLLTLPDLKLLGLKRTRLSGEDMNAFLAKRPEVKIEP
jgi:hypothetical protein